MSFYGLFTNAKSFAAYVKKHEKPNDVMMHRRAGRYVNANYPFVGGGFIFSGFGLSVTLFGTLVLKPAKASMSSLKKI